MNSMTNNIPNILNNKFIYIVALVVVAFFLLLQCNKTDSAKKEAQRNYNNLLAHQDSVRVISSSLGNSLAEKSAFELKYNELSKEQEFLISRLEIAKKKRPSIVIQTEIEYRDTSISAPVKNINGPDGNFLEFVHNPLLPGKNKFLIEGKIKYEILLDTLNPLKHGIKAEEVKLMVEQKIDLVTGLYRDPKTGRLFIRASTDFPGITFSEMQALNMIDDPATKKALKDARKPFGIGVFGGLGVGVGSGGYVVGPVFGVGLTYQPKFLQFGK